MRGRGRALWVRVHRVAGLATALFLVVAGLTGSLLAFGADLDAWLNPRLFLASGRGAPLPLDALVQRIKGSEPGLLVDYLSVSSVPGRAAFAFVSQPSSGMSNGQVFIHPVTGELLGRRTRGACCLEPENLYYFVLHVHHSLFLPGRWGWWFMGASRWSGWPTAWSACS